jgi:hypothetical protein
MRFAHRVGLAVGAVASVAVLGGCGTSNGTLLSPAAATQLTAQLTQASTALNQYNCQVAYSDLVNLKDDINQLSGVNATLLQMLNQGAGTISTLADERCPSGNTPDTTTTTSTTSTSATTTTTGAATTSTTATTISPVTTPTSDTSTDSGGAAPTTATTPPVVSTPAITTPTVSSTTTPDSGGAGLNSSGGDANGGTGVGGAAGQ